MGHSSGLFLGLIPLLAHSLYIQLKRLSPLLQNLDLLSSCRLVVVKFVHLVVVHLYFASQICAFALINAYFLSLLGVFHFKLPYAVLDRSQFRFLFFDYPVS